MGRVKLMADVDKALEANNESWEDILQTTLKPKDLRVSLPAVKKKRRFAFRTKEYAYFSIQDKSGFFIGASRISLADVLGYPNGIVDYNFLVVHEII